MKHHGKKLSKLMEEAAKSVLRQERQAQKDRRKQRQADRRKRYAQPTQGTDPSPDPGARRSAPGLPGAAEEDHTAGEARGGRPWDDC